MTVYVGGIRTRLISDSFYDMVRYALMDLHWFDSGRQHSPIELTRGEVSWDNPVPANTLAISDVDIVGEGAEMGSNLEENRWQVYVDFYAESDSLGTHMAGDLRDILRGKMPSIGRGRPICPVYDYTVLTEGDDPRLTTPLFNIGIENVVQDRAHNASRPYLAHWFSVRGDLVDFYGDEDDLEYVGED